VVAVGDAVLLVAHLQKAVQMVVLVVALVLVAPHPEQQVAGILHL
jgi:hypothetical protein